MPAKGVATKKDLKMLDVNVPHKLRKRPKKKKKIENQVSETQASAVPSYASVEQKSPSQNWEAFLKSQAQTATHKKHRPLKVKADSRPAVEVTDVVALDCEMVGAGDRGREDLLARVSVVNLHGEVLYDSFVKPLYDTEITDYRTKYSGVRPSNLQTGADFREAQGIVANLIKGRMVVGHDLKNDFKVLLLGHPRHMIRDTSKYKEFRLHASGHGKAKPSLKVLAEKILDMRIQQGEHDSVVDAKAAMALYMLHQKEWEASLRKKRTKKSSVPSVTPGSSRALLTESMAPVTSVQGSKRKVAGSTHKLKSSTSSVKPGSSHASLSESMGKNVPTNKRKAVGPHKQTKNKKARHS